jgi:hypothetical protein
MILRLRARFAFFAVMALPFAARAQSASVDTVPRGHIMPGLGVHVGVPQKASVGVGVILGEDWQTTNGHDRSRNVALFAEPGIAAGRASLAYLDHGYGSFGSGFGIAATVLRTWKDPWNAKPNVTYVGSEVFLWPVFLTGPRIGLFHSVAGTTRANRWLVSASIGIGI